MILHGVYTRNKRCMYTHTHSPRFFQHWPLGKQCCPTRARTNWSTMLSYFVHFLPGYFKIANNLSYIVATLLTYLNVHGLFHFCSRLRTNQEQNENNPPMGCVVIVCSVRPFRGVFWKTVDTLFHMVYNSNMKYILWTPCILLGAYIGYIIVMMIWGTFNG